MNKGKVLKKNPESFPPFFALSPFPPLPPHGPPGADSGPPLPRGPTFLFPPLPGFRPVPQSGGSAVFPERGGEHPRFPSASFFPRFVNARNGPPGELWREISAKLFFPLPGLKKRSFPFPATPFVGMEGFFFPPRRFGGLGPVFFPPATCTPDAAIPLFPPREAFYPKGGFFPPFCFCRFPSVSWGRPCCFPPFFRAPLPPGAIGAGPRPPRGQSPRAPRAGFASPAWAGKGPTPCPQKAPPGWDRADRGPHSGPPTRADE